MFLVSSSITSEYAELLFFKLKTLFLAWFYVILAGLESLCRQADLELTEFHPKIRLMHYAV